MLPPVMLTVLELLPALSCFCPLPAAAAQAEDRQGQEQTHGRNRPVFLHWVLRLPFSACLYGPGGERPTLVRQRRAGISSIRSLCCIFVIPYWESSGKRTQISTPLQRSISRPDDLLREADAGF